MDIDKVYCGDALEVLKGLPSGTVNCCVTSPPYWGLRDYGTANWEGGDKDCDHVGKILGSNRNFVDREGRGSNKAALSAGDCVKCGAKRIDKQMGLEPTPEEYVAKMVEVFREVKRVLRHYGTLWLNLGDSYASSPAGNFGSGTAPADGGAYRAQKPKMQYPQYLKPKDLCGIPWRVAFALQADGWYLRQDIIWYKPNPMPESVRDRCTKAHEYIFLLTKKPRYYYDADAIRENGEGYGRSERFRGDKYTNNRSFNNSDSRDGDQGGGRALCDGTGRNKRSVWTVTTKPYSEAHFATFPPDLILPCILAGCPVQVCKKCGEPRRRIVEKGEYITRNTESRTPPGQTPHGVFAGTRCDAVPESKTTGWTDCGCNAGFDGGIVLDPFMGSGTVGLVAYQNNRHYIGIELNPEYCTLGRIEEERDKYALFEGQQ